MMIINCSAAAASHLYGKYKKNSDEGFFEPASTVNQTIMERQVDVKNTDIIQWVVHAVKIGRSTCLIAMEYQTRWVHVIHQVRKGDVQDFVERLNSRLINGMEWIGTDFSLFTDAAMEQSIDLFFKKHTDIRFYQQTERSVMTHISQVSARYQYTYNRAGEFPEDEEMALGFDLSLNDDWRCRKGEKYDLKVQDKMLLLWLTDYQKISFDSAMKLVEKRSSARRYANLFTENIFSDIQPIPITDSDNVIDINQFKDKIKKQD